MPQVLIIDDEGFFLKPLKEVLEEENISYQLYKTGHSGWLKLSETNFKVVVLDMKVRLGDEWKHMVGYKPAPGIFIFEKINKIKSDLPVICYTVLRDDEIVKKINELGGKHISKGITDSHLALVEEIKKYL